MKLKDDKRRLIINGALTCLDVEAWRFAVADNTFKLANPSLFSCSPFSTFSDLFIWYCLVRIRKIAFWGTTASLLFTHESSTFS